MLTGWLTGSQPRSAATSSHHLRTCLYVTEICYHWYVVDGKVTCTVREVILYLMVRGFVKRKALHATVKFFTYDVITKHNLIIMHELSFSMAAQRLVILGFLLVGFSKLQSYTQHSVGLLWRSHQPDAETYTSQHVTRTRYKYPCPPAGFEPAIPAREGPQTHALDRTATGMDACDFYHSVITLL